ncbi:MAG: universal stress protein [Candidatus Xenobia bacterium]
MTESRPDPEALLKRVTEEEQRAGRGSLKVYLGYASHVGKTLRLLEEARRRAKRGEDVVIGWLKADPAELEGLEVLPAVTAQDGNQTMDLEGILKRHPKVAFIDELAFTNPPGSKHAHRWEDIEEICCSGIDVVTAVNIHYLEGLKEPIQALAGVRKSESVPDDVVLKAEEVMLVDVSPEVMRERYAGSNALLPEHELLVLRELALLYAADTIEKQLQDYRHEHHIEQVWSTQERILVCVTAHPRGEGLVARGHRAADRLHGELWVLYVTPDPEWSNLSAEERTRVQSTLALARTYHAQVEVVEGRDPSSTIVQYAREHAITQIYMGHALYRRFPFFFVPTPVARVVRLAEGIDVHVVANPGDRPSVITPAQLRSSRRPPVQQQPFRPGRLRIYLGYAAGVGKTYQMLRDGKELLRAGKDVVVGYFEPHGRPDTMEQLEGLGEVPRKALQYRDRTFEEMDLEAVLKRRPEICLVDEYAHTNVPGSKHEKRFQDVDELLEAGIHVFTTINVQHLESLNDAVHGITSVRMHETVPDSCLAAADEIVFVDVSTQALLNRLQRGVVYPPEKAVMALQNFFKESNLKALRELAMRQTADRVDLDLMLQSSRTGDEPPELVLVCLNETPDAASLIRRGRRMADRLHGRCFCVYVVKDPSWSGISPQARVIVEAHFELARTLDCSPELLVGADVAHTLATYCTEHGVTQIFFGRPRPHGFKELFFGNTIERVMRLLPEVDVHVASVR